MKAKPAAPALTPLGEALAKLEDWSRAPDGTPSVSSEEILALLNSPVVGVGKLGLYLAAQRRLAQMDPGRRALWAQLQKRNRVINWLQSCVKARAGMLGKASVTRILGTLEAERLPRQGAKLKPIPKRSKLAWLPEISTRLVAYLASKAGHHAKTRIYGSAAHILRLASGEEITTSMVKAHVRRHAKHRRRTRRPRP